MNDAATVTGMPATFVVEGEEYGFHRLFSPISTMNHAARDDRWPT
jgi:hypothetical protein